MYRSAGRRLPLAATICVGPTRGAVECNDDTPNSAPEAEHSSESSSSGDTLSAVQDLDVAALQQLLVEEQNQMIWPDHSG